jgi:hypothetical protein
MTESLNRKRQIEELKLVDIESLNPYRNIVIDEIADAILKMEGFGKDTLHSFAIFIRGLK